MKFVPIDPNDIPKSTRPSSKSATLIREFQDSGVEVGEVTLEDGVDKTVESTRSSLDNYIVRHNLPLAIFTSGGRLFLRHSDTLPSDRPKRPRKPKAEGEASTEGTETDGTEPVENRKRGRRAEAEVAA